MGQLLRLGKRGLICLQLFTCNYVVSFWRGFLFPRVLGMGYVILLWHSLSLPYNYLWNVILNIICNNDILSHLSIFLKKIRVGRHENLSIFS